MDLRNAEEVCECCGLCCRRYQGTHWAKGADLVRWFDAGRRDILEHCRILNPDGDWVSAAALTRQELLLIPVCEGWCDPATGEPLDTCPFLAETARDTWICAIHAEKPAICCSYCPWDWAEIMGVDIPCPAVQRMRGSR
jgi:hypothetical protein